MNRRHTLLAAAALLTFASSACTASQSWGETEPSPTGSAPTGSAPTEASAATVSPVASTPSTPVASATSIASAGTASSKKGVTSCKDVTLEPTKAGGASACSDEKGIVVVAVWHLEGTGKARRASGTIDRFQNGAPSLHTVVATDDPAVISALETAELASLDVRPESGAVRVGLLLETGEDYRTMTEVVSMFLENQTKAVWTGLGNRTESEMDTCTKASVATFAFPDNAAHIERTITSTASFIPQALDAALLNQLKKGCVAAKPASKRDKFVITQ